MSSPSVVPISVVIPTYNRPEMTARAVRSALAQRPSPPAEVIVVDDGSTDDTGSVAAGLGARVIRHERNQGKGEARNTGIAAAEHAWIGLLDSDDEWLPTLLSSLWPLRGNHLIVAGAALYRGPGPADARYDGSGRARPRVLRRPADLVYPANPLPHSGVLIRADAVRAVGGYDPSQHFAEDLDLWLRVLERGTAILIPDVVVDYHLHAEQVTQDKLAMSEGQLAVLRRRVGETTAGRLRIEAWRGGAAWDDLRRALRETDGPGAVRAGLGFLGHPARLAGLLGLLVHRRRMRARTADVLGRPGSLT